MGISIRTDSGVTVIGDDELARLQETFPGIQVAREVERFAEWIARGPAPPIYALTKRIDGWLRKARPIADAGKRGGRAESGLSPRVKEVFDAFLAEGSIRSDFRPNGETDRDQILSLRSMATRTWEAKHPRTPQATPEQMERFMNAWALAKAGGDQDEAMRLLEAQRYNEATYVHLCDRCQQHYDQTVAHDGRALCLWCWGKVTARSIPYRKPEPGTWRPGGMREPLEAPTADARLEAELETELVEEYVG